MAAWSIDDGTGAGVIVSASFVIRNEHEGSAFHSVKKNTFR